MARTAVSGADRESAEMNATMLEELTSPSFTLLFRRSPQVKPSLLGLLGDAWAGAAVAEHYGLAC